MSPVHPLPSDALSGQGYVPYFVVAGTVAAWTSMLLAIGLSGHRFPHRQPGTRALMILSAVLILATMATAVIAS